MKRWMVVVMLLASSCSSTRVVAWSHPSNNHEKFRVDSYECKRDMFATMRGASSKRAHEFDKECMEARGYKFEGESFE